MYVDTTSNTLKIMNAIACWIAKIKKVLTMHKIKQHEKRHTRPIPCITNCRIQIPIRKKSKDH
jgi:hypothetical protein